MWDNLALPWQLCFEEAWLAYCAGSVPIGAVVTDAQGRIIGRGRNRITDASASAAEPITAGPRPRSVVANHELAHAELNALLSLHYSDDIDPHAWVLYTTLEPCPLCLGAFYMSCLRQMHYAARDPYSGSVNLLGTTPYLSRKPMQIFGPLPSLEAVSVAFVVASMPPESSERTRSVCGRWREIAPLGAALGERWAGQQTLPRLRAASASAAEVVVRLSREIG